jgi:uncharacterized protein YebE (UPF0316 family)
MNLLELGDYFDPLIFDYLVLPGLIFFARMVDMTLGTVRIIFVARSMKTLAPIIGFFESLIWLFAISQIIMNLSNIATYLAFAAGFAAGNYVGIYIESKLAVGLLSIRAVTTNDASDLINYLRENNFGVTSVSALGVTGRVRLIISVIKRKDLDEYITIVKKFNPKAFVSIEDVRSVQEGFFPSSQRKRENQFLKMFTMRK